MTYKEAAERLGVDRKTVMNFTRWRGGKRPRLRVIILSERKHIIHERDLEDFVRRCANINPPPLEIVESRPEAAGGRRAA